MASRRRRAALPDKRPAVIEVDGVSPVARPDPESGAPVNTLAALGALGRGVRADLNRLGHSARPYARATAARLSEGVTGLGARLRQLARWTRRKTVSAATAGGTAEAGPAERETTPTRRRPLLASLLMITVTLLGTFIVALVALAIWALHDIPLDRVVSGTAEPAIVLQAADGQRLVQQGPFQDLPAAREEFPDHLIAAILSIEDRRFYSHWGVDLWGVSRALSRNVFAGEVVEGGSTITQQLVKILHLESARTLRRKVQEVFLSLWLESRLTKDEILTRYLNTVYMGAGATGIPAAARIYFDKRPSELSLAESALLAGLIAAPSALNPLENLDGARQRASLVLEAMVQAGYLDEAAMLEARTNSAQLHPRDPDLGTGTWFADWVMQDAHQLAGPFRGSISVTTTIVPDLQARAEAAIAELLDADAQAKGARQAALVALGPDGAVLAMVGGVDYAGSAFNRAVDAQRQPGSTFKLFVYLAALRAGLSPASPVRDEPVDIEGWTPENFDGRYYGEVSVAEAFARSLNAATVRMGMEVGIEAVVAAARDLGIDAPLVETPSLLLGASEVSLLDLTGAFASVRAGVAPVQPWGIRTFQVEGGGAFGIGPQSTTQASLGDHHLPLVALLQLAVEQGTGTSAAIEGAFAAGKTGTSQDHRDAWFIGFNETMTVGVWVGNDESEPMDKVTGGQLPALIWKRFMTGASGGASAPASPGIIERETGVTATEAEAPPPQCNIRACSRAYRSFRASDCTFQPYRGQRRICEK